MKIIDQTNDEQYNRVGVSKNGTVHLGYWDDDLGRMKWVPKHAFKKCKNRRRRAELMRLA